MYLHLRSPLKFIKNMRTWETTNAHMFFCLVKSSIWDCKTTEVGCPVFSVVKKVNREIVRNMVAGHGVMTSMFCLHLFWQVKFCQPLTHLFYKELIRTTHGRVTPIRWLCWKKWKYICWMNVEKVDRLQLANVISLRWFKYVFSEIHSSSHRSLNKELSVSTLISL